MKTWEQQRQSTLSHWKSVRSLMSGEDVEEVVRVVTRTTEFCTAADEMQDEFGGTSRCDLCAHASRYGSCLGMTHAVLEQISANRWDRAGGEVDRIIAHLEAIA